MDCYPTQADQPKGRPGGIAIPPPSHAVHACQRRCIARCQVRQQCRTRQFGEPGAALAVRASLEFPELGCDLAAVYGPWSCQSSGTNRRPAGTLPDARVSFGHFARRLGRLTKRDRSLLRLTLVLLLPTYGS